MTGSDTAALRGRLLRVAGVGRGAGASAVDRILAAGLDLARLEHSGADLDEVERSALEWCDRIGGVRGIIADEHSDPSPRDPDAPGNPADPLYDF